MIILTSKQHWVNKKIMGTKSMTIERSDASARNSLHLDLYTAVSVLKYTIVNASFLRCVDLGLEPETHKLLTFDVIILLV